MSKEQNRFDGIFKSREDKIRKGLSYFKDKKSKYQIELKPFFSDQQTLSGISIMARNELQRAKDGKNFRLCIITLGSKCKHYGKGKRRE